MHTPRILCSILEKGQDIYIVGTLTCPRLQSSNSLLWKVHSAALVYWLSASLASCWVHRIILCMWAWKTSLKISVGKVCTVGLVVHVPISDSINLPVQLFIGREKRSFLLSNNLSPTSHVILMVWLQTQTVWIPICNSLFHILVSLI